MTQLNDFAWMFHMHKHLRIPIIANCVYVLYTIENHQLTNLACPKKRSYLINKILHIVTLYKTTKLIFLPLMIQCLMRILRPNLLRIALDRIYSSDHQCYLMPKHSAWQDERSDKWHHPYVIPNIHQEDYFYFLFLNHFALCPKII